MNSLPQSRRAQIAQADLLATMGPMSLRQKLVILLLSGVVIVGIVAYIHQCFTGLAATAMTNYFSWGVYIINFVFWIGISHAGMLVSAILRATGQNWRRPICRMAEGMTIFALLVGSAMIVIDMGRPDRLLNLIFHGRLQSPILWDVLSVTTYFSGSVMYLYLPLIPDLAMLRDHPAPFAPWRRKLYSVLSLGWQNGPEQQRALHRAIAVLAVIIIPVAISVHTVVSWIFGMTLRAGWHSTIFGPYFVVGAIYSGIAGLLIAMAVFVWIFKDQNLGKYITVDHFEKLSLLLLAVTIVYIYFTLAEYLTMGYVGEHADQKLIGVLLYGQYAMRFWLMAVFGLFVPAIMLSLPWTRNVPGIVIACILINIGMWMKRFLIVIPTLGSPFIPPGTLRGHPLSYSPTWVEWSITAAGFAAFCIMYLLFSKIFPIVSLWELEIGTQEERARALEVLESTDPNRDTGLRPVQEALEVQSDQTPQPAGMGQRPMSRLAIIALALLVTIGSKASAQGTATLQLSVDNTGDQPMVQAIVQRDGKPIADVPVPFFAQRSFGRLPIGDGKTAANGVATVPFPDDLPGNASGEITLLAELKQGPDAIPIRAQVVAAGAVKFEADPDPFPRALWAPHAPVQFLASLLGLFFGIWLAYLFVIWQFVIIKRHGRA